MRRRPSLWEKVPCGSTAESLGLENCVAEANRRSGSGGMRPHDLRHHAITKLAESSEASEQTVMAIAGHVSREMLEHYSHIRQPAKRRAIESLDNVTITSQLAKWEAEAKQRNAKSPITKGE
jgi:integrase-like protein